MRNTARLIQLADHLRNNVTDAQFHISPWFSPSSIAKNSTQSGVKKFFQNGGRAACGGGHAIILFGWPTYRGRNEIYALRQLFNITTAEAEKLFGSSVVAAGITKRLEQANVIEHFAKTGKIDYSVKGSSEVRLGDIVTIRAKVVGLKDHDGDLQLEPLEESVNGSFYYPADQVEKVEPRAEPKVGDRVKWNDEYDYEIEGTLLFIDGDFAFVRPDSDEHQSVELIKLTVI